VYSEDGKSVAYLEVYQYAATQPTIFPSGTSTYTWATGAFTAPQATYLESVLKPLYALLSTHIATTRNKGTA